MLKARKTSKTQIIARMALMTAIVCVLSLIAFPLGFVPISISLGTLGIMLAGALLGPVYGTISVIVYIILGACGLPLFQGFRGGIEVLAGPTGGYLLGYVFLAAITGLASKKNRIAFYFIGAAAGSLVCYAFGTMWFMILMKTTLTESLVLCVVPFIPVDIIKVIIMSAVTPGINKALYSRR